MSINSMRASMDLTIVNVSTRISDSDLKTAVTAISRQVMDHFAPEWGVTGQLHGVTTSLEGKVPIQGNHSAIIYLGDSSQDPTTGVQGALGYHTTNFADVPYGFVYLDVSQAYGESWTCTLSHEVLELLADPDAMMTVTAPAPGHAPGSVYYDLEVCDPTQGDSYPIDTVEVSNFVGRSYFGLSGGSGKSNYLSLALEPFGVRPGGYFQFEDGSGAHQIHGDKVTRKALAAKRIMETGRRNERRATRINQRRGNGSMLAPYKTDGNAGIRVALATDPVLRRKVHQAMGLAAYNIIKDAGISISAADIADAQGDLTALTVPLASTRTAPAGEVRMDTTTDIASIASSVATIAVVTGF